MRELAQAWVSAFERALAAADRHALRALFAADSHWRDNGALTWDFKQYSGRDTVIDQLVSAAGHTRPRRWRVSEHWPAPALRDATGAPMIEAFFDFETERASAVGLLHAHVDPTAPTGILAHALYTRIEGLTGVVPQEVQPRAPRSEPGEAPEVLVVGAGQAGLMLTAHLLRLGVDVVITDAHEHVGDNWRHRYESLCLHNPIGMNGFPFLAFPPHYPEYLPKDMVGDWLESYAGHLGIDVRTSTTFVGAAYDYVTQRWQATMRTADGRENTLLPAHIVLATGGTGGRPRIPALPGLSEFQGAVCHSSEYVGARKWNAETAIVIGTGSSGHDVALDLHNHGVRVTILQRGPAVVNAIDTANSAYAEYFDPDIPTDLVDIRYGVELINPLRELHSREFQDRAKILDKDLHDRLTEAGMRLSDGVEGRGFLDLFLRTGGGYYFNTGASDAIIAGSIQVAQSADLDRFIGPGASMRDGRVIPADLVVLATGYENRRTQVEHWFGREVAERVGDVARLDAHGEWANIWSQTPQPGLWFNAGGINQVRPGSKILALLIKAELDGAIPPALRRAQTASVDTHPVPVSVD